MSRRKLRRSRGGWQARRLVWAAGAVLLMLVIGLAGLAGRWGKHAYDHYRVDRFAPLIEKEATANGLPASLVRSVVIVESGGNPKAESPVGALGLMQVRPSTAAEVRERFGIEGDDLLDPQHNLAIGTRYLAYLNERFEGDRVLAVAAYHMGPTAVSKLRTKHPQLSSEQLVAEHAGPKTRAYVRRVLGEAVDG